MNERIKELAKQSYERRKRVIPNLPIGETWIEFDADGRPTNLPDELVFNKEKFAELIVRECIDVAIHKDDGMISTADIAGYMSAGRASAAKMIAKHFGVE